jgi:GTP-binding protein
MKKRGYELLAISALARTDIREMLLKAVNKLTETPALEDVETPLPVYRPKEDTRQFEITRENGQEWRVAGAGIERAANMTYFEHDGSLRRFQKLMGMLGVEEALRKAGVKDGDTVMIGDYELEWQD